MVGLLNGTPEIHVAHVDDSEVKNDDPDFRTKYLDQIKLSQENIENFVYPSNIKNRKKSTETFREVI